MPPRPGSPAAPPASGYPRFPRRPLAVLALFVLGLAGAGLRCGAQDRTEQPIGPGVRVLRWTQAAGPQALSAVEVDRAEPLVRLGVSLGAGPTLGLQPLSRQAERLTRPERYPIAGINGDYFYYPDTKQPGIPTNAAVVEGELVRTPFPRSCLVLDAAGAPSIRILRAAARVTLPGGVTRPLDGVNQPRAAGQLVLYTPRYGATTRTPADGAEVVLAPDRFPLHPAENHGARVREVRAGAGAAPIPPDGWVLSGSGAAAEPLKALKADDAVEVRVDFDPPVGPGDQVLGGGPRLVRDGKVSVEKEGGTNGEAFARARYPRTAFGFNKDRLYLVTVDGRLPGYSAGMSLYELAQVLVDLGCTDAINLDGGGSTTLWVRGSVVNRPSDGRERPVANGLLVFSTAPQGPPVRLAIQPGLIAALPGAEAPLAVAGQDQYYNPIPVPVDQVKWTVDPALGEVRDGRFVAATNVQPLAGQEFLAGTLEAVVGDVRGSALLRIYPRPAKVEVFPPVLRLGTATQQPLKVRALDSGGRPLLLPGAIQWTADPAVTVDAKGTVVAGMQAGRGEVRATIGGVTGAAQVEVAEGLGRALEDFETRDDWKLRISPPGTPGALSLPVGTAHSGKKALRLEYDFSAAGGTRAVYAVAERPLGQPFALKAWVYGDGQGAWLRARIRDAKGQTTTLDLARRVDWKDSWRELRAPISDDLPTPLTLEALYLVEIDAARKPKGAILIDDVGVEP